MTNNTCLVVALEYRFEVAGLAIDLLVLITGGAPKPVGSSDRGYHLLAWEA